MADFGLHSPETFSEKYVISKEKPSIVFGIGSNVTVQLNTPSDVDNGRERDSSNVQSKVVMNHKGEFRQLRGGILTANGSVVAFRSVQASGVEAMKLINFQTKERHTFKDFPQRSVDCSFAQHHKFFAVLLGDTSLYIFDVSGNCEKKKFLAVHHWPAFTKNSLDEQPQLSWCPFLEGTEEEAESLVAIWLGRQMYIVNVSLLKEAVGNNCDIDFEDAKKESHAIFEHFVSENPEIEDLRITSVRISPDSTAVAVAQSHGPVIFFTSSDDIDDKSWIEAQRFEPRGFSRTGLINDIIFLDDLTPSRRNELQFWRSCVVISNDGRKLGLYDSQGGFKCLGRIRFETTRAVNKFISIADPSARFLHLLDVDGMNLYTVEVSNPDKGSPRFVGVTQTSFCHPIYAICPISVNTFENAEDAGDDLFNNSNDEESEDEDYFHDGEKKKHTKTKRHFIAIGQYSMMELQMTLREHIVTPSSTATSSSERKETSSLNIYTEGEHQESFPSQGLLMQTSSAGNVNLEDVHQKLDLILARLVRLESEGQESQQLMTEQLINRFEENIRITQTCMMSQINQLCENIRHDTMNAVHSGFINMNTQIGDAIRKNLVETAEYSSNRIGTTTRNALTECVIPAFERNCEVLFERLNEHFRHGVSEYLSTTSQMLQGTAMATMQLAVQQQQQKNELDRIAMLQLIETNPEAAVEAALNKADSNVVEFVCSKIDPEKIIIPGNTKLSQNCLLSLVQQFTVSMNKDRDLKFRWIELVIPEINMADPEIIMLARPVAEQLLMALNEILKNAHDEQTRRYIRLLYQMARSTLLQVPTPQRNC